eukprot:1137601-Pelagomonas_calceolata.AAC.1
MTAAGGEVGANDHHLKCCVALVGQMNSFEQSSGSESELSRSILVCAQIWTRLCMERPGQASKREAYRRSFPHAHFFKLCETASIQGPMQKMDSPLMPSQRRLFKHFNSKYHQVHILNCTHAAHCCVTNALDLLINAVDDWVSYMKSKGVTRVVGLLSSKEVSM